MLLLARRRPVRPTGPVTQELRCAPSWHQKAKTITEAANYLYANRRRMRYDDYLRRGWPIASGSVEGACKNLVRDRFERSGMRWTPDMAEAMLKLRAAYLSGDWDAHWRWHIEQDQLRLYRKDTWLLDAK